MLAISCIEPFCTRKTFLRHGNEFLYCDDNYVVLTRRVRPGQTLPDISQVRIEYGGECAGFETVEMASAI